MCTQQGAPSALANFGLNFAKLSKSRVFHNAIHFLPNPIRKNRSSYGPRRLTAPDQCPHGFAEKPVKLRFIEKRGGGTTSLRGKMHGIQQGETLETVLAGRYQGPMMDHSIHAILGWPTKPPARHDLRDRAVEFPPTGHQVRETDVTGGEVNWSAGVGNLRIRQHIGDKPSAIWRSGKFRN